MTETTEVTSAVVNVRSAWYSKINWATVVGVVAVIASVWAIDIPQNVQDALVTIISFVTGTLVVTLRTKFTSSVTPSVAEAAPPMNQTKTVGAATPPGAVANLT